MTSEGRRQIALDVAKAGFVNQEELARERDAACYHCLAAFPVGLITQYVAQTAVCPKCGLDTVVPGSLAKLEHIRAARAYWFEGAT